MESEPLPISDTAVSSVGAEIGEALIWDGTSWIPSSLVDVSTGGVMDNLFRIRDNADTTKKLAFEVSNVTTATTRTITVPDGDGVLPAYLGSVSNLFIGKSTYTGGGTINTIVGPSAGNNMTTAGSCTLIGNAAGANITTGSGNTVVGASAIGGIGVATGSNNVAVGGTALGALTSGSDNVVLGTAAAQPLTTGSRNTLIGHGAGIGAVDGEDVITGNDNILIGRNTGTATTALSNAIGIGNNARITVSNSFVIEPTYVRNVVQSNTLGFNSATGEITYGAANVIPIASVALYADDTAADAVVPVGGIYRINADVRALRIRPS